MSLALALGPHALIGCGAAPEPAYPLLMSIEAPTEALRGDTLRGVVHMTNASSEPVAVDDITSTCGCAIIDPAPATLSPGDSQEVPLAINAGNVHGTTSMIVRAFSGSGIVGAASHTVHVRHPFPSEILRSDPIELSLPQDYLSDIKEVAVYPFASARETIPATVDREAGTLTFRVPRGSGEVEIVLRRSASLAEATTQRITITEPPETDEPWAIETGLLQTLRGEHKQAALEREAAWEREAGLTPADQLTRAELAAEIERSIRVADVEFSPERRRRLARRVAERLLAMTSPTIDGYLEHIDRQSVYRTTTRDDHAFRRIASIYEYEFGEPPTGRATDELHRDLWRRAQDDKGFRIAEIGTGDRGVCTAVFAVRTPQDVGVRGPEALGDIDYWLGQPSMFSSMAFHQPKRTLEDHLEAESVATIAAVHAIARLENDTPACLIMLWYLDETANEWVCYNVLGKSARLLRLIR